MMVLLHNALKVTMGEIRLLNVMLGLCLVKKKKDVGAMDEIFYTTGKKAFLKISGHM